MKQTVVICVLANVSVSVCGYWQLVNRQQTDVKIYGDDVLILWDGHKKYDGYK